MTAGDWQRIDAIYHEAVALPADRRRAFLDEACGTDAAIRSEIESLLDHTAPSASFIEEPAMTIAARLLAAEWTDTEAARTGTTIGHLRIGRKLGAGGMGIVYEADDTRLGRKAAVKLLPAWLVATPAARDRFAHEARAASALNHPHICTIYAVHDVDGQPCIEMELLEGQTLRERMTAPLPTGEIITIAMQVSDALEAAHAKGIVHRDLKPANIFLTGRGAKILDFGIATLGSSADAGASIAGTPAYMAPEQFTGRSDARSDLFSLGAVLREMTAGRGPAALERVIAKAADPAPDRRYQSVAELRRDLVRLQQRSSGARWRWIAASAIAASGVALGAVWYTLNGGGTFDDDLRLRQVTHNTSEYRVSSGAISPTGRHVAYADPRGLHVIDLETNNTTAVAAAGDAPPGAAWDVSAGWLADGNRFVVNALVRPGGSASSIWISTLEGPPTKLRDGAEALAVSPDGKTIAFSNDRGPAGERSLWLMDADGRNTRKAFDVGGGMGLLGPSFSPDSRRVVYARTNGAVPATASIEVRDLEGGPPATILTPEEPDVLQGVVWLQDGRLLYSLYRPSQGTAAGTAACSHWQMRIDDRARLSEEPSRLAGWLPQCVAGSSFTADSRRALLLQSAITDAIRIIAADGSAASTRLTATEGRNIPSGWTRDERSIVFVSDSSGRMSLYRQSVGHTPQLLTDEPGIIGAARLTPDGDCVLYLVGSGREPFRLNRVSIDGGPSSEIARGRFIDGVRCSVLPASICAVAERSEDGRQIIFRSLDLQKGLGQPIARIDASASAEIRWALSPDAARIAVLDARRSTIQVVPLAAGSAQTIVVNDVDALGYVSWTSDANALIVPGVRGGVVTLQHVTLDGRARTIFQQAGAIDMSGIPSPSGAQIAAWVRARNSSLWLAESP